MSTDVPYLNRELSWLDFNARVLAISEDPDTPLLERAKFLAIHGSNLDEFFQVRVAGHINQIAAGLGQAGPDLMTSRQVLVAVRDEVAAHYRRVEAAWDQLVPLLADEGIAYTDWDDLDDADQSYLTELFYDQMFPVLTPLAVDPAHPFPYISNKSLNLAVFLRHPDGGALQFARVKLPSNLPRMVGLPDGITFVPLEQVLAHHLVALFPGLTVEQYFTFRVTRDADLSIDDSSTDDLLEEIESQLARRRFGEPVRLEVEDHIDAESLQLLERELELETNEIFLTKAPLDKQALWALYSLDRPELKYPSYTPQIPPSFLRARAAGRSMFAMLRDNDVMVHHPYESFASSVEEFIARAARDKRVLAIKMTMYRTASESSIIRSLIEAAEAGKQVAVLVEIKARFDEQANIEWARRLERAGVHVAYGLVGLKTHSKTALVVRQEGDEIRRYGHIGTGNYNADTARIYEDIGLFTADPQIGADLTELFNSLTGYSARHSYKKLVVAPHSVRASILELIDIESHFGDGHIFMKMNSLVDPEIIQALYTASQRGTRVDLIVRGICCLLPGVPGLSDNIRVMSVVGRYLEHSRLFRFGSDDRGKSYLIGSADMMQRNLDGRVEALVPITQSHETERLDRMIDLYLNGNIKHWRLDQFGGWRQIRNDDCVDVHVALQEGAAAAVIPNRADTI